MLKDNKELRSKVIYEITDALNSAKFPDYLRSGRLVPLQKTVTKGPVALEDIRPIVVRSHISKIMEKAILTIYKRPDHMMPNAGDVNFNVDTDEEM